MLEKDTTALTQTQTALATLSTKILDINKPQAQKFIVRRDDSNSELFTKYKRHTQLLLMTNVAVPAHLLIGCDEPMPEVEAHILEGGPRYPDAVRKVKDNIWLIRIPSPQVTPQYPLIITIGYDEESVGKCFTEPQ